MTIAEFGLWTHFRQLSYKSGELYADGREVAKSFDGESKDHVYRLRKSLVDKGWLEHTKKSVRGKSGRWTVAFFKVLEHADWIKKHGSKHCKDNPEPFAPMQTADGEPVAPVQTAHSHLCEQPVAPVQTVQSHQRDIVLIKPSYKNTKDLTKVSIEAAAPSSETSSQKENRPPAGKRSTMTCEPFAPVQTAVPEPFAPVQTVRPQSVLDDVIAQTDPNAELAELFQRLPKEKRLNLMVQYRDGVPLEVVRKCVAAQEAAR